MVHIVYKSLTLVFVIMIGYVVKKVGLFSKERDFETLSKLILYITLPSVIVTNLNGLRFPPSLLILSVFGFACNWLYIFISKLFGQDEKEQGFMALNINGYNIGNFALPFIVFFLQDSSTVLAISLFDMGNSLMVLGGNYIVAKGIHTNSRKINLRELLKTFFKAPTVIIYIIMVFLSLASLNLPNFLADTAEIMGSANTFLSMFLIGIALEFNFELGNIKKMLKYLSLRYIPAFILSSILLLLPFLSIDIKLALGILLLAPVASSATIFTNLLNEEDVPLSAQVNSLTVMISLLLMSLLLIFINT